ncbi:MAG: hypothetical protein ABIH00_04330 [Armatimonadota bacterium]
MKEKTFYSKLDLIRKIRKKYPAPTKLFFFLLAGAPFLSGLASPGAQSGSEAMADVPLYKSEPVKNCKIVLTDEEISMPQNAVSVKDTAFVNCLTNCNCATINCNCSQYFKECTLLACQCNANHQWGGYGACGGYPCDCYHNCNCVTQCQCDQNTGSAIFECNCVTNCQNPNM